MSCSRGIELRGFSVELEGDIDTDGFMGLNPDARPGFLEVRNVVRIACDAPEEEARAFVEFVETRCPVSDNLSNGVPITCAGVVVE